MLPFTTESLIKNRVLHLSADVITNRNGTLCKQLFHSVTFECHNVPSFFTFRKQPSSHRRLEGKLICNNSIIIKQDL